VRLLAPFVVIVVSLAAMVWLDDTPAEAELVFVNQNDVFTLDPQRMSYVQDLRLAHALYEGLVRWDNDDFSILPGVARELPEIDEEGLTYTFRIRSDASWSNGQPVTAHDFVYSWRRAILPDTAADYSNMFFAIEGAAEVFTWRAEQTAAFAARPWNDDATPAAVGGAVRRLTALLDADDLPPEVARPAAATIAEIRAELKRLRRAAGAGLAIEIAAARQTQAWWDLLDERSSRAAEAAWMWERTETRFAETVRLEAVDVKTLRVRLHRPVSYFLDLLCFGVFFPVYRPAVEGWELDGPIPAAGWSTVEAPPFEKRRWLKLSSITGKLEQKHGWSKPGRHVGNGPYRLDQWRYKRDVRLERNPYFHDPDRVKCDSILILTIEDVNTAVLAFESGDIDWLADVSADYQADMIEQMLRYRERNADRIVTLMDRGLTLDDALAALPPPRKGERRDIHTFPTFGTDFYSFNCRPKLADGRTNPFADARVRRAFTLAVDKRTIVEQVTRLHEPVMQTLIPPGTITGYSSPAGLSCDPARARSELAKAGWIDRDGDGFVEDEVGRPFPVVDLLYTTNIPRYKWISLDLKAQWENKLGVRIDPRASETKFYREDLKLGRFMIARGRWYGDYGDPTTFLDLCRSTDGNNDRRYNNPRVDELLDDAAAERDPELRMALLSECERIIVEEDLPILPICQLIQVYMYEPGRVSGLSSHPRLTQFLWQMQVHEE